MSSACNSRAAWKRERGCVGMGFWEILVIGIGLSMDAFAVAVCKGLSFDGINRKKMATVGLYFGGFQALMPCIGYFLGYSFRDKISAIDHWIAFVLLTLIGLNMAREAVSKEEEKVDSSLDVRNMLLLSVATSIDALAIGVTFAFLQVNLWIAVSVIGLTTFLLSCVGVKVGSVFGEKFKSKAELAGGVILVFMGLKILLEHLGVISF